LSLKRVDDSLAAIYGDLKTQADNLVTSAGNWIGGLSG
ncbi:phage tail protein, partial [Enterobacter hormaechei]|nr:phage tail protein [Enterobacter hormaechei]